MSVDLIIWYIRMLYLFTVSKALGPKLAMMYEMVSLTCIRIPLTQFIYGCLL